MFKFKAISTKIPKECQTIELVIITDNFVRLDYLAQLSLDLTDRAQ
ncbi:MAG: hypothetical protein QNJ34_17935 [Xenococcaceae cyanobacterium MO_188.B29]|nr:hypothetical protein [Xenococcaceae cyanobacterium MO_188.B29]